MALFVNNATCPTRIVGSSMLGRGAKDGSPRPSAVNSLAWSSVEERMFTGDTDGFVKVYATEAAYGWRVIMIGRGCVVFCLVLQRLAASHVAVSRKRS